MFGEVGVTEEELRGLMEYAPFGLNLIDFEGTIISQNLMGVEIIAKINAAFNNNYSNIFKILKPIFPDISTMIQEFTAEIGMIFVNKEVKYSILENDVTQTYYLTVTATKHKGNKIILSFEDITERLNREESIRQALLDKAVEQGKFEIASNVLHDIGNAVVGFGSYLTRIKRLSEQSNVDNLQKLQVFFETQKEVFATAIGAPKTDALISMLDSIAKNQINGKQEIQKSIAEQMNIIAHIQEILHIQRQYVTGNETTERRPVNIRSIINDCMAMLFASFDKRGIAVTLNLSEQPLLIKGDRTKLMQVILNVLKNSVEAIELTQPKKEITIVLSKTADALQLQVHDTGQGFDEMIAEKMFTRGYTSKSSGSGLGLYNCKTIIESHSGTINITSDGPGKGALTTIKFAA